MMFGPEYIKINTAFKRDDRNVIIPGDWSVPEFAYLADRPWMWTEKVDGTNIRLHWDGSTVTIGGRTDNAQLPATLVRTLRDSGVLDEALWRSAFSDADDVTVYGEGYGAKIQSGGMYRPDQSLILFDVLVGRWWLEDMAVGDIAGKLGLETVPVMLPGLSLNEAWEAIKDGALRSQWEGARIEGLVGRPAVDLFNRRGERVVTKLKAKDWADYQRRSGRGAA